MKRNSFYGMEIMPHQERPFCWYVYFGGENMGFICPELTLSSCVGTHVPCDRVQSASRQPGATFRKELWSESCGFSTHNFCAYCTL